MDCRSIIITATSALGLNAGLTLDISGGIFILEPMLRCDAISCDQPTLRTNRFGVCSIVCHNQLHRSGRKTKKRQRNPGNFHNKTNFQNKTLQFHFLFAFVYLSASTNSVSRTQTLMADCTGKQEDK